MCFHHPRPLKTISIQNNPIKKGYKTHNCHGPVDTWRKRCSYLYSWASHPLLFLKLRFIQESVQQGI
jgi:hypothetical protein